MKTLLALALVFVPCQDDKKAKALVTEGNDLFEAKKHAEALAKYEEALKLDAKNGDALFNGGLAAFLTEKPARAAELWERLKEQKPEDTTVLAKLVQAYQASGKKEKRDATRDALIKARAKLDADDPAKRASYCRDQFVIGGKRVMAFEYFELTGPRALRYRFSLLTDEGKEESYLSLGSYDITTAMAREMGDIGKDERMYHLDGYYDGGKTHRTFAMYKKEPSYDDMRASVVEILEGKKKPVSSSEKK